MTDSKWLLFILHQLLSNAVKYTERGRVSIRVTSAPAIIVADTGIGIAPEDVPRVFEKGYTGYNGRGGAKIHRTGTVPRPSDRRDAPLPCVAVLPHWGGHERHH